ncbi:MAG: hypothetical protein JNM08_10060, partial [Rubrivivax sp.]|nr:hypothetical protein [Rubrivivax sp.]
MPRLLDLHTWPRRGTYEYFRGFGNPYFNVCLRLDLTGLVALRPRLPGSLTLAYHHLALRAANEEASFRYRFDPGGGVRVLEQVHGSMTVLQPDESIAFARLPWLADYPGFAAAAWPRVQAAQRGEQPFDPADDHEALVHFTTWPWVDFSSFSHARRLGDADGIPKIAFGRLSQDQGRWHMAMAVEVHHAL